MNFIGFFCLNNVDKEDFCAIILSYCKTVEKSKDMGVKCLQDGELSVRRKA